MKKKLRRYVYGNETARNPVHENLILDKKEV
jgi:hypothetical protein